MRSFARIGTGMRCSGLRTGACMKTSKRGSCSKALEGKRFLVGIEKPVVLIVEDQKINRQILRNMLCLEYEVLEAENGADGLEILERRQKISAILLDVVMPVMDGYTFLTKLKGTAFSKIPVIVMTGDKDENAEQMTLDLGAWDFISKPYQSKALLTRLKNVIVRSQFYLMRQMKHAYEHDPLTDLYNRNTFFLETRRLLDSCPGESFALVRFDIDHFQIYNSFFGEEEGDRLLLYIAGLLRGVSAQFQPCTYGRIAADVFCVCIPFDRQKIEQYSQKACEELTAYNREYRIEPSFGIYAIRDAGENVQAMYDCAMLAAKDCKGKYLAVLSYYQPEMSTNALQEQRIINEMQNALETEQFEVYLQPKYDLKTERPYGAEALIRWKHPEKGMLLPRQFIPVFERNGFIGKVDFYMWEKVCALLRHWLDEGRKPEPISVNISRVNMYNPKLLELLLGLTRKYRIPPSLLPLELTESAYMQNPEVMQATVKSLQQAGFSVMMDDFGSGYSSLNTLKDIPVDVLKIDMNFLSGNADSQRSKCILTSVVRMAGWMSLPVIMEGVETRAQVEFLKDIGCGYAQGYYFAKPMQVSDYEALVEGVSQAPAVWESENLEEISRIIWCASPEAELLFNTICEPAAVCELLNGNLRALKVNPIFYEEFGDSNWIDAIALPGAKSGLSPEDAGRILKTLSGAGETKSEACCAFRMDNGGKKQKIELDARYWGLNENSMIFFLQFRKAGRA